MQENWDDMRLFLAVAREASLTGAGKVLRLDPATVGRRMARLEDRMQAQFFAKSPQGYVLTEAGRALLDRAAQVERVLRSASGAVTAETDQLSGQIRIGAPDGCANFLLPQVCAAITAENPDLDIQIVALPRVFNLSRREADMVVGVSMPPAGRLMVQKITEYHLHLAAAQTYLDANGPLTRVEDLSKHRVVGYIPDMIFDRELDYLGSLGIKRVPMASNSVAVQLNMIRHGGGIGVVHDFALPFVPQVVRVLPEAFALTRTFYMIRHPDDRKNPRLSRCAEALTAGLRQEVLRLQSKVVS